MTDEQPQPGRPPSAEEKFLHETAYKDSVESITRLEDVAKTLLGTMTAACGLLISALKLAAGQDGIDRAWGWPLVFWGLGLLCLMRVIMPREYPVGRNEPESMRQLLRESRDFKWGQLQLGVGMFFAGLATAAAFFFMNI